MRSYGVRQYASRTLSTPALRMGGFAFRHESFYSVPVRSFIAEPSNFSNFAKRTIPRPTTFIKSKNSPTVPIRPPPHL